LRVSSLIFIPILLLINSYVVKDIESQNSSQLLLDSNPFLLRAITPLSNSFVANRLWLQTNSVDETSKKFDMDRFIRSHNSLALLDPNFITPTLYASIYLVNERDDLNSALQLISLHRELNRDNLKLIYSELIFRVIYGKGENRDYLRSLARELIEKRGDQTLMVGKMEVDSLIDDIISYLESDDIKREIREKDRGLIDSLKK